MVRPKIKSKKYLTPLEWEIMNAVWKLGGKPSVREVIELAYPKREKAYTTVQTVMNNLVKKSILKKKKIGLVNFYEPLVQRSDMLLGAVNSHVKSVHSGSHYSLALYIINSDTLTQMELKNLKQAIQKKEGK
jgi:predicted transcriptional regulator